MLKLFGEDRRYRVVVHSASVQKRFSFHVNTSIFLSIFERGGYLCVSHSYIGASMLALSTSTLYEKHVNT